MSHQTGTISILHPRQAVRLFVRCRVGVLVVFVISSAVAQEAADPGPLRVLSYNIHHGEGIDHKLDPERIANVILSATADLVLLQEVDRNLERSDRQDQPKVLARLTGMHVVFGANISENGGGYGNAILSRFPIRRHQNHHLPRIGDSEQRGIIVAEIEIPGQTDPLILLATHLDYRADDRERIASVEVINRLTKVHGDRPAILGGDLNAVPDSQTLTDLKTLWEPTNDEPRPTIPVDVPQRQIDYVLLRPASRWEVVSVEVLPEAVASDHRPILAVLKLR